MRARPSPPLHVALAVAVVSCHPVPAPSATAATAQSAAAPTLPPPGSRTEDEQNTISVFRAAAPSAVFVTQQQLVTDPMAGGTTEVPIGSGSGFIWDVKGHVVTNFHVVDGAKRLTVTLQDQRTYPAVVVGVEPRKDIAVVRVDVPTGRLQPIARYQAAPPLEVGQKVIAIGNPFGLDHTLTSGIISALGREVNGIGGVAIRDMIQTDAAINPGNSGGPLLDSSGRLIGMNTMILSRSGAWAGIGFAVPIATIDKIVPQLIKSGRVEQIGLGVRIDPRQRLERQLGLRGVVVLDVLPGSPAERAGLRGVRSNGGDYVIGDVIVGVDGSPVTTYDDLYRLLDGRHAGEIVTVQVVSGDQPRELKLPLVVVE